MKQILKRGLALLVAMVLCIGLLPQGPVHVHAVSQTAGITNTVAVGDKIVIATRDGSGAMGAQNGKYRSQVAATVADRVLTVTEEIVVLTVEAGTKSGSFALKAADGYLCYDATAGGNTKPLSSPWVMMIAPMIRVDIPHEVSNGYCRVLSRPVYCTLNAREKPSPKKWLVPLCSALPSCIIASMV